MLLNAIKANRDVKMIVPPLFVGPRRTLNSLWRESVILDQAETAREGEAQ